MFYLGIFVIGGRGDEFNRGNTAEFLPFEPTKGHSKWLELPNLMKSHPNMPGVSYMNGALFVIGGGGPPLPGGEKTVRMIIHISKASFW